MKNDSNPIAEYFERDHDEIDALLASVDFTDSKSALPRLTEFDRRLERHVVWEEGTLFPAAARVAPALEGGPIAVMKLEHVDIRRLKQAALDALRGGNGPAAKGLIEEMLAVLGPHNMKEEHMLYPACDGCLAGPAARAVMDEIKASAAVWQ